MKNLICIVSIGILVVVFIQSFFFKEGLENQEQQTNSGETELVDFCNDDIREELQSLRKELDRKSMQQEAITTMEKMVKEYESLQNQINEYVALSRENTQRLDDLERQCR